LTIAEVVPEVVDAFSPVLATKQFWGVPQPDVRSREAASVRLRRSGDLLDTCTCSSQVLA